MHTDLPAGYAEQRRRIVQLLKDAGHPYSTYRSCNPFPGSAGGRTPEIPLDEVSDGHWNLTPEAMRRSRKSAAGDPFVRSHEALAAELRFMRDTHPLYHAAQKVFLSDVAGDADYELLKSKAGKDEAALREEIRKLGKKKKTSKDNLIRYWLSNRTGAMKLRDAVEVFIRDLTLRLIDVQLHVVFPEALVNFNHDAPEKTNRRLTMEENYREIHRVFEKRCEELSQKHKRYRNKAFNQTAIDTGQSRATVERAVHFVESGQDKEPTTRKEAVA